MALLAHWTFDTVDGPCSDSSGAGQHLAYVGDSFSIPGKPGGGRLFATGGGLNYAQGLASAESGVAAESGTWTFSGWIRPHNRTPTGTSETLVVLAGPDTRLLWIRYASTHVGGGARRLALFWGGGARTFSISIPFDDAWHHVALTSQDEGPSSRTLRPYLDGVPGTPTSDSHTATDVDLVWQLGVFTDAGPLAQLDAGVSDFRFYSSALSAAEVLALYNYGAAMGAVSLTTLRARVREACDQVGTTFVTDAATSIDAFINTGLDELYDVVLQHFGEDYYVSSSAFSTVAGTSAYSLPSDFYKLLGVDLTFDGESVGLEKFSFAERNAFKTSQRSGDVPRYRLEGSNLRLYPAPASVTTGTLWYVPTRTPLVLGADTVNFPGGWEEYAVLSAAISCVIKEEGDPSALMARKADQLRRIESAAGQRDAGAPMRVTDVDAGDAVYVRRGL